MSRLRPALLTLLLLPALIAGCGGSEVEYEQVNSAPPVLEIPQGSNTGGLSAGEDAGDEDANAEKTPTPTPTATDGTTVAPAPTAAPETAAPETGGAAPETEQPAPETAPEDTGGAGADEGLDQFCADNPGACDE